MDDPREQRDVVASQAVRVSAAVRPLVVELDDRDVRREEGNRAQHPGAYCRVLLDDVELGRGQRSGLVPHEVRDADTAEVVEEPRAPDRGGNAGVESERARSRCSQLRDATRVPQEPR